MSDRRPAAPCAACMSRRAAKSRAARSSSPSSEADGYGPRHGQPRSRDVIAYPGGARLHGGRPPGVRLRSQERGRRERAGSLFRQSRARERRYCATQAFPPSTVAWAARIGPGQVRCATTHLPHPAGSLPPIAGTRAGMWSGNGRAAARTGRWPPARTVSDPDPCPNGQAETGRDIRVAACGRGVLWWRDDPVATKRATERARAARGDAGRPAVPAGQVPAALRARHTRDLRILAAIAEALNSAPDVQQALEQTLGMVAELLGLETGWVWLRDPETQRFYNAAARNLPPFLREPVRMTGRSCWCLDEFRAGDLTPKNIDVMECSRLRPAVRQRATELTHGLAYHASIPLYFQTTPLGVMNVTGPAWRQLTADELRVLATIAYQVGIAIE